MNRRLSLRVILASSVAIFVGLSTFLGLILGDLSVSFSFLSPVLSPLGISVADETTLRTDGLALLFIEIAVATIAISIVIGVLNLLGVHAVRFFRGFRERRLNPLLSSAAILISFMVSLLLLVLNPRDGAIERFLLEDIIVPVESTLAGLLFFALVYGAFKYLRDDLDGYGLLFIGTVLLVLIGALPNFARFDQLIGWLLTVPVNAGASGILLGIALATVVTGVRILIGQDRSYGE